MCQTLCQLDQAQNILKGALVILVAAALGFFKIHRLAVDGEDGTDDGILTVADVLRIRSNAAYDGHHGDAAGPGPLSDAAEDLAPEALAVQPALAGQDHVAALQHVIEAHQVQYRLGNAVATTIA